MRKYSLFYGIRRRWIFNSLGIVFLIAIVAVAAYAIAAVNYYTSSCLSSLTNRAKEVSSFLSRFGTGSYNEFYRSVMTEVDNFADRDRIELDFVGLSGRVIVSSAQPVGYAPGTPDVKQAMESIGDLPASFIGVDSLSGERVMSVSAPLFSSSVQPIGVMRYVISMKKVDAQILAATGMALLLALVLISFVTVANLLFLRSILTPIQEVNETAKKIAAGSYGIKIEKKHDDELGELTETINNMSAEISLAEKIKNDFISSVSHELRTPLTAISGWGETLMLSDFDNKDEVKKGLRIMLKEASRLTRMVEGLLEFTRIEGGRMVLQVEEMDLRAEFEEIVYLYMDSLARDGIVLSYENDEEIPAVTGDRARLRQVFINLLDNAVKHGGAGRKIDVAIRTGDEEVTVSVRDYGQGIPVGELPHVKAKFYKGSSKARGSGIGLAVSDEIVRLHEGTLEIESEEGQGTCVRIRLPLRMGQ